MQKDGAMAPEAFLANALAILAKGKGDPSILSNNRGILLQSTISKICSSIIANRLQKLLTKNGIETQMGSMKDKGTRDGIFTLRSLLQISREHKEDTYVLFIDLVKAFDTARHDLIGPILLKYGCPQDLINIILKLYDGLSVQINLEGEKREIPYTCGVRKGDPMAPLIFLFFISIEKNLPNMFQSLN